MNSEMWQVIFFTVKAAALSTLLITPFSLATAWLLAKKEWRGKSLVETLVMLPLFVPPVATGLILLLVFGRNGPVGALLEEWFGITVVFTWKAVVIACGIMAFPLYTRTVQVAFQGVNPRLEQIAQTLGAGRWRVFFTITLPLALRGIIAGAVLAFARAMGEFGATAVVAGMIPGKTMTLSLSMYHLIQLGQDEQALRLLLVSVLLVFGVVWLGQVLVRGREKSF